MYEVLAILKPDAKFTVDQMATIVEDVCSSAERQVDRDGDAFSILAGDSQFHICFSDAPHVIEESSEIAEHFGIPCTGCSRRYEMAGHDPDMELFNDYLLINERLDATGCFVLFDQQEGKLLFED